VKYARPHTRVVEISSKTRRRNNVIVYYVTRFDTVDATFFVVGPTFLRTIIRARITNEQVRFAVTKRTNKTIDSDESVVYDDTVRKVRKNPISGSNATVRNVECLSVLRTTKYPLLCSSPTSYDYLKMSRFSL